MNQSECEQLQALIEALQSGQRVTVEMRVAAVNFLRGYQCVNGKRFNCRTDDSNTLSSMTPIENSFYSYAELTEEQKIRFAEYQVFDMPKKASSNIKDTINSGKPEVQK